MAWQFLEIWWPLLLPAAAMGALVFVRTLTIWADREITLHETAREATELYIRECQRRAEQRARRKASREALHGKPG